MEFLPLAPITSYYWICGCCFARQFTGCKDTSHVALTAVHSRRSRSGQICQIAPEKAQARSVSRAMGAGVNEKQVGGMLARPSPLTQYLPHEYAIVVSSETQAGVAAVGAVTNGACSGRRGLSGLLADCGTPGAYIIDAAEDR
jgi:hypothetical protein